MCIQLQGPRVLFTNGMLVPIVLTRRLRKDVSGVVGRDGP